MTKRVLVLGAGASGYAAAIEAAAAGAEVTLLDHGDRTARKVLASGNGRCNLSNRHVDVSCYCTQNPLILQGFLDQSALVDDFFAMLGVHLRADDSGRLYPWSNRAQSVRDALCLIAEARGVTTLTATVTGLDVAPRLTVHTDVGDYTADSVVVALGSTAAPSLGATDVGLRLACSLGLDCRPFAPALTPLATTPHLPSLKGCRHFATLTLTGSTHRVEEGEVLFTDYGLSGVAVMQLSAFARASDVLSLDLLPRLSDARLKTMLFDRFRSGAYPTVDKLLVGLVDKPLSFAVLKEAGISPLDMRVSSLRPPLLESLVAVLKGWRFVVSAPMDMASAQVASGGVLLPSLDAHLQSVVHPGVYFTGEVVDVTGLCGGYNLHWAWLSGIIAGRHAGAYT